MIDKITKDFISRMVVEINKPENKKKLENEKKLEKKNILLIFILEN